MHLLLLLFSLSVFARDISGEFRQYYETGSFSESELDYLRQREVVFIPGFGAELFILSDPRGDVDFSRITRDYFGNHLKFMRALGIPARRLRASSASVPETLAEIQELLSARKGPVIFFTHSLGGMALLEHLLSHPEHWSLVAGIVFLQSPFTGAPVADVAKKFPALRRVYPHVNVSDAVINYLSVKNRKDYVEKNQAAIEELTRRIPVITAGGVANGYRSVFSPSIQIIRSGCLTRKCLGPRLYPGPYDNSDGMVPFEGSKLPGADFVLLPGADHGETVLEIPFRGYDHWKLTRGLLKLLL